MSYARFRRRLEAFLAVADVRIDGDRPWDIQVHNEALFPRVFAEGTMGFGESYMEGWWDCERLDECFFRMWRYFLMCAAGGFRARMQQIWQIVFSVNGLPDGYAPKDIR